MKEIQIASVDFFNVIIENFTMRYSICNVCIDTFIGWPPEAIMKVRQDRCIKNKRDEETDQKCFPGSYCRLGELVKKLVQDAGAYL